MSRLPFIVLFLSVSPWSASAQSGHLGTPQEQGAGTARPDNTLAPNAVPSHQRALNLRTGLRNVYVSFQ
jgi:hypothetical protein